MGDKGRSRGLGVGGTDYEVELLNRLSRSAQLSGDGEVLRVGAQNGEQALSALMCPIDSAVALVGANELNALENGCLGLGAKALEGGELAVAAGLFEGIEGLNAEGLADGDDLARPQAGDSQHVEQTVGRCGAQLFIGLGRAGVGEFGD